MSIFPRDDAGRVVVTGIGLWTPLGTSRESTWQALSAGRTGIRWLPESVWTGSRLSGAPCERPGICATRDPVVGLAESVAREALSDAGLHSDQIVRDTTGIVFGTSKGGLQTAADLLRNPADPYLWTDVWPSAAASHLAGVLGSTGPCMAPVAACATGLVACQRAADLIREGRCEVVFAGSSDASLQPAILGSFLRLGVLAHGTDEPEACRPFDSERSGFVVGEGAGCLVLESLPHARSRGASWYGEWISGRLLSDPTGLTQLSPGGEPLLRLLADLRAESPGDPDYINLHGTGTRSNDRVESQAVRMTLGPHADAVSCSSLKGALGHLLGAAGTVELAATLLALRDQTVPPTTSLRCPDPELMLDFTPGFARSRRMESAWKLSLGFGGHLSAACVARLRGSGDRTRTA